MDVSSDNIQYRRPLVNVSTIQMYDLNELPFAADEADALQKQALPAVISTGSSFGLFEDPEMKILLGMLRTTAPDVIPTGKVVGGRLLDGAAEKIDLKISKQLKNRNVGLCTDGWKSQSKAAVNAPSANVDFRSFLIELLDVTALKKDGPSQCEQFSEMIDRVELKNGCIVIYFTTDSDGGSKKGRLLLGKKRPWLILPSYSQQPEHLAMYSDGSLLEDKESSKRCVGYGVAGYHNGNERITRVGPMGSKSEVYDAEMAGLAWAACDALTYLCAGILAT
ncbi:hypothetical protein B0H10DRAFT_1962796 [Mycena sp. CBHHK59/15]|nr:hypothetical protein B0H10DRAFT_1962796 [Mycena sp. CBHHK59/15]